MTNPTYPPRAGQDSQSTSAPTQPFAGEAPIITDSAESLAAIVQYEVCALTPDGITPFLDAEHTKDQMVVAGNAASASGKRVGYYTSGRFNHEALTWPAEYDTLLKRKAFVSGTNINIGHLLPNPVSVG